MSMHFLLFWLDHPYSETLYGVLIVLRKQLTQWSQTAQTSIWSGAAGPGCFTLFGLN